MNPAKKRLQAATGGEVQKPVPANMGDSREFGMVTFFGNVDK